MCTIIVLNEHVEGYPLIIAANRDERHARASSPPAMGLTRTGARYIRPWNDERGGTWMGVGEKGWFVGITNQDDGVLERAACSRGRVVRDCLLAAEHAKAAKVLSGLDVSKYNPFNVVFGRPGAMFLTRINTSFLAEMEPLPAGINVVSNDCLGSAFKAKTDHASSWSSYVSSYDSIGSVRDKLFRLMCSHDNHTLEDPYQALCVHDDSKSFGTRSTSIITVSKDGNVEYWYSEGHPCQSMGLALACRIDANERHEEDTEE